MRPYNPSKCSKISVWLIKQEIQASTQNLDPGKCIKKIGNTIRNKFWSPGLKNSHKTVQAQIDQTHLWCTHNRTFQNHLKPNRKPYFLTFQTVIIRITHKMSKDKHTLQIETQITVESPPKLEETLSQFQNLWLKLIHKEQGDAEEISWGDLQWHSAAEAQLSHSSHNTYHSSKKMYLLKVKQKTYTMTTVSNSVSLDKQAAFTCKH